MPRLLIAPLDWGLGHATRCVAVIRECMEAGWEVHLASSGDALALLRNEFPCLDATEIPAYNIRFPFGKCMTANMLAMLPNIRRAARREHAMLGSIVNRVRPDVILSDNRFGMYHPEVPSVFMTHQINIQTPAMWRMFMPLVRRMNHSHIRSFDACWVPDTAGSDSLSGKLSVKNSNTFFTVDYIGHLSRFSSIKKDQGKLSYDAGFILSGPEPSRSRFGRRVLQALLQSNLRWWAAIGASDIFPEAEQASGGEISMLPSTAWLEKKMSETAVIICRPGYSSVMDMAATGCRAVFVPTPGQTEQEYLAAYLHSKGFACASEESSFNLPALLAEAERYGFPEDVFQRAKLVPLLEKMLLLKKT